MFDVRIISTGSEGNCVVIDESLMIDAGLTKKKIVDSGYDLSHLQRLLISHKHADHTNLPFIRWAIKQKVQVHLPSDVIDKLVNAGKIDVNDYLNDNLHIHTNDYQFQTELTYDYDNELVETVEISMHPQKHYDIVNYAFVVQKPKPQVGNKPIEMERLLYSTDLDTIGPTDVGPGLVALGMFDTIILEGNFDEVWLRDYINLSITSIDPDIDASQLSDSELDIWVRDNYRQLPKRVAAGLFRAVQNMRHLSKQQARLYASQHLKPNGRYFEVHRSSLFYERPDDWTI